MVASRFSNPALNLNYAFKDPLLHRTWGPVPVHLAAMFAGIVIVFYLPVHLVLDKVFARPTTTS